MWPKSSGVCISFNKSGQWRRLAVAAFDEVSSVGTAINVDTTKKIARSSSLVHPGGVNPHGRRPSFTGIVIRDGFKVKVCKDSETSLGLWWDPEVWMNMIFENDIAIFHPPPVFSVEHWTNALQGIASFANHWTIWVSWRKWIMARLPHHKMGIVWIQPVWSNMVQRCWECSSCITKCIPQFPYQWPRTTPLHMDSGVYPV